MGVGQWFSVERDLTNLATVDAALTCGEDLRPSCRIGLETYDLWA